MKKETQICFIIDFIFVLSICCILYFSFALIKLTLPFIAAFPLALIFIKLSERIKCRFSFKSKWAVIASALFFYAVAASIIWLFTEKVINEAVSFSGKISEILDTVISESGFSEKVPFPLLQNNELKKLLYSSIGEIGDRLSRLILEKAGSFIKNLPLIFSGFLFTILSSFYISVDYENIKSFAKKAIPQKFHFFFLETKSFFTECLGKIAKAYLILMALTFLILTAGFYILKVESFIKISAVTALLDVLPLLGTGCVLLPWALFEFIKGSSYLGWGLIILWLAVTIVRNTLEPHLIGKELGLPPLLSLIACFWGLKIMGLKGMVLFPVGFLAVKFIFSQKTP